MKCFNCQVSLSVVFSATKDGKKCFCGKECWRIYSTEVLEERLEDRQTTLNLGLPKKMARYHKVEILFLKGALNTSKKEHLLKFKSMFQDLTLELMEVCAVKFQEGTYLDFANASKGWIEEMDEIIALFGT